MLMPLHCSQLQVCSSPSTVGVGKTVPRELWSLPCAEELPHRPLSGPGEGDDNESVLLEGSVGHWGR